MRRLRDDALDGDGDGYGYGYGYSYGSGYGDGYGSGYGDGDGGSCPVSAGLYQDEECDLHHDQV